MKNINDNTELELLIAGDKPLLLKFYADWCSDCKAVEPVLEGLSNNYEEKIEFAKIDVEKHQDIAKKYNVRGIPAIFFLKNGKIIDQARGIQAKEALELKLKQLLA
jgi:thioredoxin